LDVAPQGAGYGRRRREGVVEVVGHAAHLVVETRLGRHLEQLVVNIGQVRLLVLRPHKQASVCFF
jgi:hypothetical protein